MTYIAQKKGKRTNTMLPHKREQNERNRERERGCRGGGALSLYPKVMPGGTVSQKISRKGDKNEKVAINGLKMDNFQTYMLEKKIASPSLTRP